MVYSRGFRMIKPPGLHRQAFRQVRHPINVSPGSIRQQWVRDPSNDRTIALPHDHPVVADRNEEVATARREHFVGPDHLDRLLRRCRKEVVFAVTTLRPTVMVMKHTNRATAFATRFHTHAHIAIAVKPTIVATPALRGPQPRQGQKPTNDQRHDNGRPNG